MTEQATTPRRGATPRTAGAVLALGALAFLASKVVLARVGHVEVFEAAYLLLAFVHFYLDGLIWAFKDPHVRSTIGPPLLLDAPR